MIELDVKAKNKRLNKKERHKRGTEKTHEEKLQKKKKDKVYENRDCER